VINFTAIINSKTGGGIGTTHTCAMDIINPNITAMHPGNSGVGIKYGNGIYTMLRVSGGSIKGTFAGIGLAINGTVVNGTRIEASGCDLCFNAHLDNAFTKDRFHAEGDKTVVMGYSGDDRVYVLNFGPAIEAASALYNAQLPANLTSDGRVRLLPTEDYGCHGPVKTLCPATWV
jgi:hypothetical protein